MSLEKNNILNNLKKKFISNIIFGQKLINDLSVNKSNKICIEYFMNHLNTFEKHCKEDWCSKINFDKYCDLIPSDIEEKLENDTDIILKNNYNIEPYCKKTIKIITPLIFFKKMGFHFKLIKLESQYFDLMGILFENDNIVGYVCCGKRSNSQYKNLYVVLRKNYENNFYGNLDKKIVIMNEISEEINFYEKNVYLNYLKNYRSILFSLIFEIIHENPTIKNVICIGEEEGGNLLQIFSYDFLNNRKDSNLDLDKISLFLFTHNTSKLSTNVFFDDLTNIFKGNSIITCFDKFSRSFETWNIDEKDINNSNMNIVFV